MPVAEMIKSIQVGGEFRTCTVCGYDQGFHVSFRRDPGKFVRIILICPECGSRFDVDWDISLPEP